MELIKIFKQEDTNVVSARELHTFLEVGTEFSKWIVRMLEYGFEENIDFNSVKNDEVRFEGKREVKRELIDYALTLDCAKEISMIQRSEKGKQARQYFIECEKTLRALKESKVAILPSTYLEALKELVVKEELNFKLLSKVEEDKPKIEFFDLAMETEGIFDLQKASGLLKLPYGRNKLFAELRNLSYLQENNMPYRKYLENQLFEVKEVAYNRGSQVTLYPKVFVTQKGLVHLQKILKK